MANLYMVLIGCTPNGRHTEQHDVFFGIGESMKDLVPQMVAFWPEAKGKIHIDAWRKVTHVDGYAVRVVEDRSESSSAALFFLNLGGYKRGEFDEFHYRMVVAAGNKGEAVKKAKQTAFYKHTGFKGAESHIDDKYGVDVDDVHAIEDILPAFPDKHFHLDLQPAEQPAAEDEFRLGYFRLDRVDKWND